jgi:hypothetical protein
VTTKIAVRNNKTGELGISYMGGVFNKFKEDGLTVDEKRHCYVLAIDYNYTIPRLNTFVTAEWAWIFVDVPATYTEQFGSRQCGGYADFIQPLLRKKILMWEDAVLNAACRIEYVDWNRGEFNSTGGRIGDETWSIMPAISFRPTPQTVIRFNYRYQETKDIFGNPPEITGTFSLGLSTYF